MPRKNAWKTSVTRQGCGKERKAMAKPIRKQVASTNSVHHSKFKPGAASLSAFPILVDGLGRALGQLRP